MKNHTVLSLLVTTIALSLSPTPGFAQNIPSFINQVHERLNRNATLIQYQRLGYQRSAIADGYILVDSNRQQDFRFTLEAGHTYIFVGECDEDCKDMDFFLFDPDGNKIAADERADDSPAVLAAPTYSGVYILRATIPKCNAFQGCYWSGQALVK